MRGGTKTEICLILLQALNSFDPRLRGEQVVTEDKRQLCVAHLARSMGKPWLWWSFAAEYSRICTMANG